MSVPPHQPPSTQPAQESISSTNDDPEQQQQQQQPQNRRPTQQHDTPAQPTQQSITSTTDDHERHQQHPPNAATQQSHASAQPNPAGSTANYHSRFSTLSTEEIDRFSEAGTKYCRSQFQQMGLQLNPDHPSIPPIKESISILLAQWKRGLAMVCPNIEQACLNSIESQIETDLVYGFLGMLRSTPEPALAVDFGADVHPAVPSP